MIQFTVPGKAQGKARARTFYNPKMGKMMSVTPEQTVNYENLIKISYIQAVEKGYKPTEKPVTVEIEAIYRKVKTNKMEEPMLKPDVDNIAKVVLDALNGLAYIDDKQVISLVVRKVWGEPEELIVKIEEV
jgi:Holliday junction resolvase RusA-like endonuclease